MPKLLWGKYSGSQTVKQTKASRISTFDRETRAKPAGAVRQIVLASSEAYLHKRDGTLSAKEAVITRTYVVLQYSVSEYAVPCWGQPGLSGRLHDVAHVHTSASQQSHRHRKGTVKS
jgi:hypothetical protein